MRDANGRALAIELATVFNRDIPGMVPNSDPKRANETANKIAEASGATPGELLIHETA